MMISPKGQAAAGAITRSATKRVTMPNRSNSPVTQRALEKLGPMRDT